MSEFPEWVEREWIGWQSLTPEEGRALHRLLESGSIAPLPLPSPWWARVMGWRRRRKEESS